MLDDKRFSEPVRLVIEPTGSRQINSAWEAVECLHSSWPSKRGRAYRSALRSCLDVLDGLRPVPTARRAFARAAKEAGVLGRA